MLHTPKKNSSGFTLIELLVVIGIIAILSSSVIVAVNPARQLKLARNSQRTSNVNAILNAIGQRIAENKGTFEGPLAGSGQACPTIVPETNYKMYKGLTGSATDALDLSCLVPTYMPSFPADPKADGSDTGYVLRLNGNGRMTVSAPFAELDQTISAER